MVRICYCLDPKGAKMTGIYRSAFVAIVAFSLVWFIMILICIPQNDENKWKLRNLESQQQRNLPVNSDDVSDHSIEALTQSGPDKSPLRPEFDHLISEAISHEQSSHSDVIYHEFTNDHHLDGRYRSPISQKEHEIETKLLGVALDQRSEFVKKRGDKLFSYNLLVSNRIGPMRRIPDTRHASCPRLASESSLTYYPDETLSPSSNKSRIKCTIIICHFNEAPSALIRTIRTTLERTPLDLLEELIVVDDFSDFEYNTVNLQQYLQHPLVSYVKTDRREGLIRARLYGVSLAKGEILVFLDSHVEPNAGWLEPLVETIASNRTTIACPIIDIINAETMVYTAAPMVRGGMNWALNFKWESIPSDRLKTHQDFAKPVESATMAGGLFAIHRDFFHEVGSYDPGMDLWGGENIEMSLRVWMCGGRILILPCSRIGHIFRKTRPYGPDPGKPDSLLYNSHRAARVWLDEYIERFYQETPELRNMESGDVNNRLNLRQSLGCQNFTWFLRNVYPSLTSTPAPKSVKSIKTANEKPKLFKTSSKASERMYRSAETTTVESMTKTRIWRMPNSIINPSMFRRHMFEQASKKGPINLDEVDLKGILRPKSVARFLIQASNSPLCIESKDGFIRKQFSRLVLNQCATLPNNGSSASNYKTLLRQIWTETESHDLRIGSTQCLDLVRNLPSLRDCHSMSSFQKWVHDNATESGTLIYNVGGSLCLAVEVVQLGEPIITTICDTQQVSNKDNRDDFHLLRLQNYPHFSQVIPHSKRSFNLPIARPRMPRTWNLIRVDELGNDS